MSQSGTLPRKVDVAGRTSVLVDVLVSVEVLGEMVGDMVLELENLKGDSTEVSAVPKSVEVVEEVGAESENEVKSVQAT